MPRSTKDDILRALYELLRDRPLNEITVKELVERCGISRQAFYYHFSDLYGVVDWAMEREVAKLERLQPQQWWQAMQQIMEQLFQSRAVVLNLYRAYERSYVEYHLRSWLIGPIRVKVEDCAARHAVTPEQVDFVTELCAMALANLLLTWMDRGMNARFTDRLGDFYAILEGSLDYMLERLAQRRAEEFDNNRKV